MATENKLTQELTDDLVGFGNAIIQDLQSGSLKTLVDTGNLKDSQIVVPSRPTQTKATITMYEAYYAPYVGSKNHRPNSFMKQHINEKLPELTSILKETIDTNIKIQISDSLKPKK
jgi:hypothetical protein